MVKGQKMPLELKQRMIKKLIIIFAPKAKPFFQIDKESGEIVTRWNSLMQLERALGKRRAHVKDACVGKRKTAYGFKWKYCQ